MQDLQWYFEVCRQQQLHINDYGTVDSMVC
jgi:hypothetical protein